MRNYVLGFIFNEDLSKVLLIKKVRPAWQAGNHNGVGGEIDESSDSPFETMIMKTKEEVDLTIKHGSWLHVGDMSGLDWRVIIYTSIYSGDESDIKSKTDEKVAWFDVKDLPVGLYNLDWLVPLSIEKIKNRSLVSVDMKYDI